MVDLIDMVQLWTPAVYIGNAKNVYKLGSFGEESLSYLWYKFSPHMMHYSEIVTGRSFSETFFLSIFLYSFNWIKFDQFQFLWSNLHLMISFFSLKFKWSKKRSCIKLVLKNLCFVKILLKLRQNFCKIQTKEQFTKKLNFHIKKFNVQSTKKCFWKKILAQPLYSVGWISTISLLILMNAFWTWRTGLVGVKLSF